MGPASRGSTAPLPPAINPLTPPLAEERQGRRRPQTRTSRDMGLTAGCKHASASARAHQQVLLQLVRADPAHHRQDNAQPVQPCVRLARMGQPAGAQQQFGACALAYEPEVVW